MTILPYEDMKYISPRGPDLFQIRVPAGKGLYGRRKFEFDTVHGSAALARARRDELMDAVLGGAVGPTGNILIARYLPEWHGKRNHLAPLTRIGDAAHIDVLVDALGRLRLREMTDDHINELVREWEVRGSVAGGPLSPKTICNRLGVLRTAIGAAVRAGSLRRDPIQWETVMPRYEAAERRAYEPDELDQLLVATLGTRLEVPVRLCVDTGVRRGEVLGIRLSDVDLAGREIRIRGQIQLIEGVLVWRDPKSTAAKREVPISEETANRLAAWIARRGLNKRGVARDTLVFAHPDGRAWRPDGLTASYSRLVRKIGLDGSLHILRHTFITYQLLSGMPLMTLARLAGHRDARTILSTYAHIIRSVEKDLVRPALPAILRHVTANRVRGTVAEGTSWPAP